MNRIRSLAVKCALVAMLAAPCTASGQVQTGTPPFGSFSGGPFDTVNNADLNVHFAVPIVNKAGGGLPFYYMLTYDSSIWYPSNGVWTPAANWGWAAISSGSTAASDTMSTR